MTALPLLPVYPLVVLDFEASALALDSFPIEVGIAMQAQLGDAIVSWSALIKPDPAWQLDTQWDPDAERLHGISRWDLRQGLSPYAAVAALNSRIPPGVTVWCDGGHYDLRWMERLVEAAGIAPTFTLRDLSEVWAGHGATAERYRTAFVKQHRPHRAGPDAVAICAAIVAATDPEQS